MINIYLMIAILLANIIAIAVVYQFIKKLDKKQILIFIAISVATMYILISIVYWISGFGIDKTIHEISKDFVLYVFVPVNVILFIPYLASQYMKLKLKKMKLEKFVSKLSILIILLIVVLIIEFFYFRNMQENIKTMQNEQNQIESTQVENQNEITNNEIENKNTIQNEITNNEIKNNNKIKNETSINAI